MSKVFFNGKVVGEYMTNLSLTSREAVNLALKISEDATQEELEQRSKNGEDYIYRDDDGNWCVDYDALTTED